MEYFLTLDWTVITASIVAFLSLIASIFSAAGASKSADIAKEVEKRITAGEHTIAVRELVRTAAKVELEARMTIDALEDASRLAVSNATFYANSDEKTPFLLAGVEFQQRITQVKDRSSHGISADVISNETNEYIAIKQLGIDKTLVELLGEKAWASKRAEQLLRTNQQIGEAVLAAERSQGIYVRQGHDGRLL